MHDYNTGFEVVDPPEQNYLKKAVPKLDPTIFSGDTITTVINPFHDKFKKSIMDQTKDYPAPEAIINLVQNDKEIPLLTLKSFSLWQGKQKSKKTTALALTVAAFIKGQRESEGVYFSAATEGVVIFFDTEQGESYAARTMKLILKLADLPSSQRLIYCDLRGYAPAERMEIIKAGIEATPNVKLVVIDGLVDLLTDFMDASEGHITTTEILSLCSLYNIHVAGVLHQNKNDKNARAHIGTISSQKCEMEICTEVDTTDRAQSLVSCINSRGIPFEPFAIRWDKGTLPCIVQEWTEVKESDKKASRNFEQAKELAQAIFKPFAALTHTEAIESIMNAKMKSESTAKRMLKEFQTWKFVEKGQDGSYRIKMNEGSRVHEGSNESS